MESFTELLSDAFSETSAPSFSGEELDFENLNFEENGDEDEDEDEARSASSRRDGALLLQEAAAAAASFGEEDDNEDKDDDVSTRRDYRDDDDDDDEEEEEEEEGYSSSGGDSEEGGSASGDEEEEEEEGGRSGDLVASVGCSDEEKEDSISAEGRPLTSQSAGKPQVSNRDQSDEDDEEEEEEASYFGRVPEKGSETGTGSDANEEEEEEQQEEEELPSGPDGGGGGGMKIERLPSSDFQCLSLQNLQDLITEVDDGGGEKMKEFSGEEHQDAGESFADYPSDLSFCEYLVGGARRPESGGGRRAPEPVVTDVTWSHGAEEPEDTERRRRDSDDSYSSSDDGDDTRRRSYWSHEIKTEAEDVSANPSDFSTLDFGAPTAERRPSASALTTQETAAGDLNSYSAVTRHDAKTPPSRGSLDDDFFYFDNGVETSGGGGDVGNGEERRSWEQEQERIRAFYEYYDDSEDDNERGGRQTKVQFFAEPLSRVIHYDSDSDRDSLSSSTERDDEPSSADTSDEVALLDDTRHQKPESDPLTSPPPDGVATIRNTQRSTRPQHRGLVLLKLVLKTGVATAAGLLVFWLLAADEADWIRQVSLF
ncbi:unnamed protein product [Ophioblennius macclurei]